MPLKLCEACSLNDNISCFNLMHSIQCKGMWLPRQGKPGVAIKKTHPIYKALRCEYGLSPQLKRKRPRKVELSDSGTETDWSEAELLEEEDVEIVPI